MPPTLSARLDLLASDPQRLAYIFGEVETSWNRRYLHERLGSDADKYDELLTDPKISGALDQERIGAYLGRSVIVDAATSRRIDQDAADTARRIIDLNVVPYERICKNFLRTGLIHDFSVQAVQEIEEKEVIYPVTITTSDGAEKEEFKKQKLLIPRLEFVPQRRFIFRKFEPDRTDIPVCTDEKLDPKQIALVNGYELRLLTQRSPVNGERCPKDRFLTFYCDGIGVLLRKYYEIRREVLKSGVRKGDRIGSQPVHGTYPDTLDRSRTEDAAVIGAFERLLRALSPNAYAATTEGFEINFPEPGSGGSHEILEWLYKTAETEISRAIWGEGSYAEKSTGSYAAAQQQAENRNENVVDSDCNLLDEQLASGFWSIVQQLNYPKANAPRIRRETIAERRKLEQETANETLRGQKAQTDVILLNQIGLSVTPEYIKETYGEAFSLPVQEPAPTDVVPTDAAIAPVDTTKTDATATDTAPTDAAAGFAEDFAANVDRYLQVGDIRVGIRHKLGETRFPQYRSAKKLRSAYGFVQGMKHGGKALRCYVCPEVLDSEVSDRPIFSVQQLSDLGELDEIKLMIGYPSIDAAELAYRREMPDRFFGGIRAIAPADLKQFADHAEANPDPLDEYQQQLTRDIAAAYAEPLKAIQEFMEAIARSDASDEEKYRQFSEGLYDLYGQIDPGAIAAAISSGLIFGYLEGMRSEELNGDS